MRKRFLAREDLAETDPMVTPAEQAEMVEDTKLEMDFNEVDSELNAVEDTVNDGVEAATMADTAAIVGDQVKVMSDAGQEMPEPMVTMVNAVMESIYNISGYSSASPKISLESNEANSKAMMIASIDDFNNKIVTASNLAQEGVADRLSNTFDLLVNSRSKIYSRLNNNLQYLVNYGAFTGGLINEPGWGRIFSGINKTTISGNDVISLIDKYSNLINSDEFIKTINDSVDIVTELTTQIRKSIFISNDVAVKNIKDLHDKIKNIDIKLEKMIDGAPRKTDPSFTPLTVPEAKKMVTIVESFLKSDKINKAVSKFNTASIKYIIFWRLHRIPRVIGFLSSDLRNSNFVYFSISFTLRKILKTYNLQNRIALSCAKYIKDSTAK